MAIDKTAGREDLSDKVRDVGRDPFELGPAGLEKIGLKKMSPLRALRLRCIDCCTGSMNEVKLCPAVACASWPFRMGKNPWITFSPERLEKMRAHGRALREKVVAQAAAADQGGAEPVPKARTPQAVRQKPVVTKPPKGSHPAPSVPAEEKKIEGSAPASSELAQGRAALGEGRLEEDIAAAMGAHEVTLMGQDGATPDDVSRETQVSDPGPCPACGSLLTWDGYTCDECGHDAAGPGA